ncbi:hypothetical protein [Sulfurimonas sp.]|uniref:hypothetical protein n=1 Tax=Sulfurimonas sp. TaxID=2022749 RepID=UPI002B478C53|nr:hypothetical protein [Sulfurimonas sp.]
MNKSEITRELELDYKTFSKWEDGRPKLYKFIIKNFYNNEKDINLNNDNNLVKEIVKELKKLPDNKKKKFYYLIMAELAEMGI